VSQVVYTEDLTRDHVMLPEELRFSSSDRLISYLPLNHIAAQVGHILLREPSCDSSLSPPVCQIADVHWPVLTGAQVFFARPDALSAGTLFETVREVKPTVFFGVPRIWEKVHQAMKARPFEEWPRWGFGWSLM
jgi:long-subunit acyl-CoA synthetase (AMP-forming)